MRLFLENYFLCYIIKMTNIKIYKITDLTNGNCYIGSTKQHYVSKRISRHREKDNRCESRKIIANGNYDYEILESFNELFKNRINTEKYYINNSENCINKRLNDKYIKEQKLKNLEKQRKKYQYNKVCKELFSIDVY